MQTLADGVTRQLKFYLGATVNADYVFIANNLYNTFEGAIDIKFTDSNGVETSCTQLTPAEMTENQYGYASCNGATGSVMTVIF